MNTIIEDLEEQVEYWRGRAERAEEALRGKRWECAVRPLTMGQTRLMRVLALHDCTAAMLLSAVSDDQPNVSPNSIKAQLSVIRTKLPGGIGPSYGYGGIYTVRDREALKAFLGAGDEVRRAAA